MPLRRINIPGTYFVPESLKGNMPILHVDESHSLIKAAGYLKFTHSGLDKSESIYFRGERKIYGSLPPTIFRGIKNKASRDKRVSNLNKTINEFRINCQILNKFGKYAHEPLLQHYGISTTWVDLVDNLWVALWFACHVAKSTTDGRYMHFEKRISSGADDFVYLILVGVDINRRASKKPGRFFGESTEVVDLRMAAPSIFLRPHAQHGLLFRCRGKEGAERPADYAKQIRGIVRVRLFDALSWLGDGKIVGTHSLFPPAYYDEGYRFLLESGVESTGNIGCITSIGS